MSNPTGDALRVWAKDGSGSHLVEVELVGTNDPAHPINKMGRPSSFTQDKADRICSQMSTGRSLNSICRDEGMPGMSTVMRWLDERSEFRENYARAIILRADAKFDELDEVSELAAEPDNHLRVAGLRLKADNIKWQLARMNSKKYGDKIETTLAGSVAVTRELTDAELANIAAGSQKP